MKESREVIGKGKSMTYFYPAVCTMEEKKGTFFVYFPDMTGCEARGHSMEEAAGRAREALAASLLEIEEKGLPFPPASDERTLGRRLYEGRICTFLVDLDDYRRYREYKVSHADAQSAQWKAEAKAGRGRGFLARLFGTR